MSVVKGNTSHNIHTFFHKPADLAKSKPSKAAVVTLSVFTGILTLGIGHLIAFLIRDKFSMNPTKNSEKINKLGVPIIHQKTSEKQKNISIQDQMKNLPIEAKQARMNHFVAFFTEDPQANERNSQEGIFRLSGTAQNVERLADSFVKESFIKLPESVDIHEVATLFKRFIKSCEFFSDQGVREFFVKAMNVKMEDLPQETLGSSHELDEVKPKVEDRALLLNKLREYLLMKAIDKMPKAKQELLKDLLSILKKVGENGKNKMDIKNLAIVFGPNLAPESEDALTELKETGVKNLLSQLLVQLYVDGKILAE